MKYVTNLKKAITVIAILLTTVVAHAQDTTAVQSGQFCIITMNTGTKVSGLLTSKQNGKVTVIDPVLGTLTIDEEKIEAMKIAETGKEYSFMMSNGRSYRGTVVAQNESVITLQTESLGEVKMMMANITDFSSGSVSLNASGDTYDHASRYLIAPSAIPLRKGEGYYQNVMLLMNGAHFGITDHLSAGGGVMIPFGFFGTVKYGHQVGKNTYLAAGGMVVTTFLGLGYGVGCGFGSLTYGNRGTNVTFTAGYGGIAGDGDWSLTNRPILNISGMLKITDGFSIVTENWFLPARRLNNAGNGSYTETYTYNPQVSLGFRIGAGQHSFDIAGLSVGSLENRNAFLIPYFAYSYRFHTNKSKR